MYPDYHVHTCSGRAGKKNEKYIKSFSCNFFYLFCERY